MPTLKHPNTWINTSDKKLTQLIFSDFSTPNSDGRFNIYDDIRTKLIKNGVPAAEIAFIHDVDTEEKKKKLFVKVRQGSVRVLIGSTAKMGAGTNIQDKLIMGHDLDCPWRPSDLEQRAGCTVRQGNQNPEVDIVRYVTEATFDAYLYQTVENKQKFISQIMSSKSPVRSCEDVDESALSYAEIKALCAGNPLIKGKMDLDIEVSRLRLLKADHQNQRYRLEDSLSKDYPQYIARAKRSITGYKQDIALIETSTDAGQSEFPSMTIFGVRYQEKDKAGDALLNACKVITSGEATAIGAYRNLDMLLSFVKHNNQYELTLKGQMSYRVTLGTDVYGNISRINNVLASIPMHLCDEQNKLQSLYKQVEDAKVELLKPFPYETELKEKSERLAALDVELDINTSVADFDVPEDDCDTPPGAVKEDRVPYIVNFVKDSIFTKVGIQLSLNKPSDDKIIALSVARKDGYNYLYTTDDRTVTSERVPLTSKVKMRTFDIEI